MKYTERLRMMLWTQAAFSFLGCVDFYNKYKTEIVIISSMAKINGLVYSGYK